jgi:hypothetical protein
MRRSALLNRNGQKMSIAVTKDVQHRYLGQKKAGLPPGLTAP